MDLATRKRLDQIHAAERERLAGNPRRVPSGPAREHVAWLHSLGMSYQAIGDCCGRSWSSIRSIGHTPRMSRDLAREVLAVRPRNTVIGTRRRLHALAADGFPARLVAEHAGCSLTEIREIRGGRCRALPPLAGRIADAYTTLAGNSPASFGVHARDISRLRSHGRAQGWAPTVCWDDDTIDDPRVIAQWTGECGTLTGYFIHVRRNIPLCGPCRDAKRAHPTHQRAEKAIA